MWQFLADQYVGQLSLTVQPLSSHSIEARAQSGPAHDLTPAVIPGGPSLPTGLR